MEFKLTSFLFKRKKIIINFMRIFIMLFFTTVFCATPLEVFSQNAEIVVEANKTISVDQVFEMIKSQTEYTFMYPEDLFKNAPKVSLKKGKIKTSSLLEMILSKGRYQIAFDNNKAILITDISKSAQQYNLHGIVTDKDGTPLPGVTVVNNTTIRGTYTNFNGEYNITAKSGDNISFSYVGFATQKFVITDQTELNVQMLEEEAQLEEVVLVGYGTQKRDEVSSAISSVEKADIKGNIIGVTSFDKILGGLVKGVLITESSGELGGGVDINIRGITSPFNGSDNNPLFVIDGVPFYTNSNITTGDSTEYANIENPLQAINPRDIESIDVLKDAGATAIYGSRGANGVIIVKTKRGKRNEKMSVSLTATTSFGKPIKTIDFLSAEQWKEFNDEFFTYSAIAANTNPAVSVFSLNNYAYMADLAIDFGSFPYQISYNGPNPDFYGTANTVWADEVFRDPAVTNQYNLSIYGGSKNTNYSITAGYTDQEGLLVGEKYKKFNVGIGIDSDINEYIKVGITTNISNTDTDTGYSSFNADLNSKLNGRPDIEPFDEDGNFTTMDSKLYGFYDWKEPNPLAALTGLVIERNSFNVLGNAYLEAKVVKNVKVKLAVNAARFSSDDYNFAPSSIVNIQSPLYGEQLSSLTTSKVLNTTFESNLTTDYSNTFGKNTVTVLAGFTWQKGLTDREYFQFQGFPDDKILTNITSAERTTNSNGTKLETGLNSIIGRVTYSYDNKYYATINARRDRSARFGPENQVAFFPSLALSWNITNENFMQNSVFNSLRLRTSIGKTGSNNVGDFAYLQFFEPGTYGNASYGGDPAIGLTGSLPNRDIRWETTNDLNIGLNFALLNNRLSGSFDVYNRKTKDALMPTPFSLETGARDYTANFADITNKGFEIDLTGEIIRTDNWRWAASVNLSKNTNTLDKFNEVGIASYLLDYYEIGKEVNLIKGYVVDHIFNDQAELDALNAGAPDGMYQRLGTDLGDYMYKDLNNDGEITAEDREHIGSAQADFFGGFNTQVTFKGLSFGAYFNYSVGGETVRGSFANRFNYQPKANTGAEYFNNTWTPERTDAEYPRVILGDPNRNRVTSSRLVYDTSYLRLRTLNVSYDFLSVLDKPLGLTGLELFVSGSNLFTITDFPGVNPTSSNGGAASIASGINRDPYPIAKTWSLGINVKF